MLPVLSTDSNVPLRRLLRPRAADARAAPRESRLLQALVCIQRQPCILVQVDFLAHTYEQAMPNYKVLQLVFDRIGIGRVQIPRACA